PLLFESAANGIDLALQIHVEFVGQSEITVGHHLISPCPLIPSGSGRSAPVFVRPFASPFRGAGRSPERCSWLRDPSRFFVVPRRPAPESCAGSSGSGLRPIRALPAAPQCCRIQQRLTRSDRLLVPSPSRLEPDPHHAVA